MVTAIGEVTLESEEAITAAREAYEALTDVQKEMVTSLEVLVQAEASLEEIKNLPPVQMVTPLSPVERISGDTRYSTSTAGADYLKSITGVEKFDTAVVATGSDFPDALSGGLLASVYNAPLILADPGDTYGSALNIMSRVNAGGKIFVLGGTSAVPSTLTATLRNNGYQVVRLSGDTRYDTNVAILNEISKVSSVDSVILCNAYSFPSALSVSSTGCPILLTGDSLSQGQINWLRSNSISKIYVIGGTSSVSDSIVSQVRQNSGCNNTQRISGADRLQTSVEVAKVFFPGSLDRAVVTYAYNFPDGLCGGVIAEALNAPIILVDNNTSANQAAKAYCTEHNVQQIVVMGGPNAISDAVANDL
ncbi:MAG: cell wall-binding repeat-containing protein [Lachnospiraceae bacterium]|nr:cell wall-binding repeat-containing protein [Candidatus Equihabitans merdae]